MRTCCDTFDKHWILFFIHVNLPRLSPGRTQGKPKCALGWLQKLTHVPLAIAILIVLFIVVVFFFVSAFWKIKVDTSIPLNKPYLSRKLLRKFRLSFCYYTIYIYQSTTNTTHRSSFYSRGRNTTYNIILRRRLKPCGLELWWCHWWANSLHCIGLQNSS